MSMTVSMYKVSVPIFVQFLTALSACLDKAEAHAQAKQIDPAFLINMRLAPDMFSLAKQVQQATAHPIRACSALAGTEALSIPGTDASFADLKARLAKTIDYVKGFTPAQIDGTEDKDITIKLVARVTRTEGTVSSA
jgi:uncharacterized protein